MSIIRGIAMKGVILLLAVALCLYSSTDANRVDVKIRLGHDRDVDTIWVGLPASLDFYIENEVELSGLLNSFNVYSADSASWTWEQGIYRINPRSDTLWNYITITEGSRMYPPDEVWEGLDFNLYWTLPDSSPPNGISPDQFRIGGVSYNNPGMLPGSLEHCASARLRVNGPTGSEVKTLCIDTMAEFVFVDLASEAIYPEAWEVGAKCWPVKQPPIICGDANFDQAVNIGDVVYLINFVFKNGSAPLIECCADANGDEIINVGEVVYLLGYIFKGGSSPVEPSCQ
jgi:hypothetical protein